MKKIIQLQRALARSRATSRLHAQAARVHAHHARELANTVHMLEGALAAERAVSHELAAALGRQFLRAEKSLAARR